MAPSFKNAFDCLPEDLLQNILERLLWRPNDKRPSGKAQQRVWLEAVCKRFQKAVSASGSLDWDLTRNWDLAQNLDHEDVFTRYVMSRVESMASLERFSIQFGGNSSGLMTFLLLVIPRALEILKEVRIFCANDEGMIMDFRWESVIFSLLFGCRKLERVEIVLWDSLPDEPVVTLEPKAPLKVSESLSSLLLYGFYIPAASLTPFIQRFLPNLQSLELHGDSEEEYSLKGTSLQKVFLWGSGCEGFDTANPANASVPNSLSMILEVLATGGIGVMGGVLGSLGHLLGSSSVRRSILQLPWVVPILVDFLSGDDQVNSDLVVDVLEGLLVDDEMRNRLVEDSYKLRLMLEFVIGDEQYDVSSAHNRVASMLVGFLGEGKIQELLTSNPNYYVRVLVRCSLRKVELDPFLVQQLLRILASLTSDAEQYNPTPNATGHVSSDELFACINKLLMELARLEIPGLFDAILDVLERKRRGEREFIRAGDAFLQLLDDAQNRKRVAASPGCLERVVQLLDMDDGDRLQYVVRILASLFKDIDCARHIANVDGYMELLFYCSTAREVHTDQPKHWGGVAPTVQGRRADVATGAIFLMGLLATEYAGTESLTLHDGSQRPVIEVLRGGAVGGQEDSAPVGLVGAQAKAAPSRVPSVRLSLVCILAGGGPEKLKLGSLHVLGILTMGEGSERALAAVPGCSHVLLDVLRSGSEDLQEGVAKILRNLCRGATDAQKVELSERGVVKKLVQLANGASREGLREAAAGALQNLGLDSSGVHLEEGEASGA